MKLLIASTNKDKIKEVRAQLKDFDFEIVGLEKYPQLMDIEEDGNSFRENALKKAKVSAEETGLVTLADDSGLEVDYLDGRPGIYSARFAGEEASDEDNNKLLLQKLKGVELEDRTARFRCVMALVEPDSSYKKTVSGKCEGKILKEPRGKNGFGYDPLFYVEGKKQTMAELSSEEKNSISHRAVALQKMKKVLRQRYDE